MTGVDLAEVSIRYGDVVAVDRLTLHAAPGRVLGMLGGNGAGKSSTLRAIGGVNPHSSGRLCVGGFDLATPDGADAARALVGYCPDIGGLITQATPDEHIDLLGSLRGSRGKRAVGDDLVERFGLSAVRDRPAGVFSHGMQRRLSVLLAVLAAREALVLDEPFDGVDPSGVEVTVSAIRDAARAGMAVIVSTHLQQLLTSACDDVAVLVKGRLAASGGSDEFSGPNGERRYADLLRSDVVEAVA